MRTTSAIIMLALLVGCNGCDTFPDDDGNAGTGAAGAGPGSEGDLPRFVVGTAGAGGASGGAEILASGIPTVANIATDGVRLYFASGGRAAQLYFDAHVMSIPIEGGEPPTILAGPYPSIEAIALHGDDVLFSSVGTQAGDAMDGFVARVAKSGGVVDVFAPAQPYANQIVVSGDEFYWPTAGTWSGNWLNGTIRRSAAGAPPEILVEPETIPTSVVVDGAYLYWNVAGTHELEDLDAAIRRRPIAGGPVETLATSLEHATAIAVSDGLVYFGSKGEIRVLDPDSPTTVAQSQFAVTENDVSVMTVSGNFLYWTENGSLGRVVRQPLTGGPPKVLAEGLNRPFGLTTDEAYVYFTVRGTGVDDGAVMRVAK